MLLKNLETMEEEKKLKNCRKLFADLDQTTRTIRYDKAKSENDFFFNGKILYRHCTEYSGKYLKMWK